MEKISKIILALVVLACSVACGNNNEYRYADNWDYTIETELYVEKCAKKHSQDSGTKHNTMLTKAKKLVKDEIPYSDCMDWEKFDKLQTVYEWRKLTEEEAKELSKRELTAVSNVAALYSEDGDCVYLFPNYFSLTDEQKLHCFLHETVHSLVDNRKDEDDHFLVEGTVEYLAWGILKKIGIDIPPAYQEDILCLQVLFDIYGEDTVIKAVCEDKIVELIDSSTKGGIAKKLNYSLAAIRCRDSEEEGKEITHVELDILSHIAKAEDVNINKWIDTFDRIYKHNGIVLETDCFKQ